ncbi:hypothetical protein G6F37_005413 [Rhizopus arrhizus]|nr:hypothetical protein G6F38_004685 [Rhizopus arrhizus]KAG1158858.1 hypothetical protein G6F37_005413 [Rhizopus arrhizus]
MNLLHLKFYLRKISTARKGLWRANPNLAKNSTYIRKLNEQIEQYIANKLSKYNHFLQEKWNLLKKTAKKIIQSFRRNKCKWRNEQIKQLQSQRNDVFRWYSNYPTCLNILVPEVEDKFEKLLTEIDILIATESRNIKRNVTNIVHPEAVLECLDIKAKLGVVFNFSSTLYYAEPIDHHDLESMLKHSQCSLVMDWLPYEILNLINGKSPVLDIYNDAINKALFPKSGQQTCLAFLPKSSDLTSLRN